MSRLEVCLPRTVSQAGGLVTRDQVCAMFHVTPETLYRWTWREQFPRPLFGTGPRSVWRMADIENYRRPGRRKAGQR